MSTICDLFDDGLVRQTIPTSAYQMRVLSMPGRHQVTWRILPLLLAACIGGLLLSTAVAQDAPQRAATVLLNDACNKLGNEADASTVQGGLGIRACRMTSLPATAPQVLLAKQAIAWEDVATPGTLSVEASNLQFINLASRLRALRLGVTGSDIRGLAFNLDGKVMPAFLQLASTGRASSPGEPSGLKQLGAFISGSLSLGDKDATSTEPGFDFNTVGITGGIDYRFTDSFILGVAFGYTSQDADLDADAGEVEAHSYSASLYSTYYLGNFFLDFTASGGIPDYKMTRNIRYVTSNDSVDKTAFSDTDGSYYSLALGVGYESRVAPATFSPYIQFNYLNAHIDSFREQGAEWYNLEIGAQRVESLLWVLGGQISYPVRGAFGTLLPQLRAEWRHEFKNDSRSLTARFINNPTGPIADIPSDNPDRDYFNVAAGVVAALTSGATVALEYETVLGLKDITNHIIRARLRVGF